MNEQEVTIIMERLGIGLSSTSETIDVVGGDIPGFRNEICLNCDQASNLAGTVNPKRCYTGVKKAGLCHREAESSYLA
jgi:hypothetical protein